jgi:hypothetical protein
VVLNCTEASGEQACCLGVHTMIIFREKASFKSSVIPRFKKVKKQNQKHIQSLQSIFSIKLESWMELQ